LLEENVFAGIKCMGLNLFTGWNQINGLEMNIWAGIDCIG
jgi:hypothetical protein